MILDHPPQFTQLLAQPWGSWFTAKKGADLQDTSTFVFDRHGGAKSNSHVWMVDFEMMRHVYCSLYTFAIF